MGQHNFLDDSNFTSLKVTSRDSYENYLGTGFFVRSSATCNDGKKAIYLVTSKKLLQGDIGIVTLDFYDQSLQGWKRSSEKQFSTRFYLRDHDVTMHSDADVDLACVNLTGHVTRKFITGVNPLFILNDEDVMKEQNSSSFLGEWVYFTQSCSSGDRGDFVHPVICKEIVTACSSINVDGTMQFIANDRAYTVMAGSPILKQCGEQRCLSGMVAEPPDSIFGNPSGTASIIGVDKVRQLLDLAQGKAQGSTAGEYKAVGSPAPSQLFFDASKALFGT